MPILPHIAAGCANSKRSGTNRTRKGRVPPQLVDSLVSIDLFADIRALQSARSHYVLLAGADMTLF